jgi:broad specificity phosphatase PhoE
MAAITRIWLIRHGEAEGNHELRYLGTTDAPLTARGSEQAHALAGALHARPIARIYASPLQRAQATALAIAQPVHLPVTEAPDLREQDFGTWENRTRADVLASDGDALRAWEADFTQVPTGGESLADVQARALRAIATLRRDDSGSEIVAVSHVGPIKAVLCDVLGLPLQAARKMWLDPAGLTLLEWRDETALLRLFNAPAALLAHQSLVEWPSPSPL